MRTEQIDYLKEVAETKSLNMAAKNLCISIQALSTSIKKLENEILGIESPENKFKKDNKLIDLMKKANN